MANAKKILVTTVSHELFIRHDKPGERIYQDCPGCGSKAEMLTLDEAVCRSKYSGREILRSVENGEVHFVETASRHLLICGASLIRMPETTSSAEAGW